MKRNLLLGLLAILVIIQFFPAEKNESTGNQPNDIATKYAVPADVQSILKTSCYDCHSNNTIYPWYTHIQPVGWWMAHHIDEGKDELNFSEFATYPAKRADHKLDETVELIEKEEMPLGSYLWIHHDAKLSPEQAKKITDWASNLRKTLVLK